jgi:16S rRNA (guanine527-N7)-methyltransferase
MQRVLDVGSGAGFPGLPLKIMYPHIELTLVDAVRKKTSFLKHAIRMMPLNATEVIHGRIENLSKGEMRGRFDTIVCRAFSDLSNIIAHALPLLSRNGQLAIWKGRLPAEEIRNVQPVLAARQRLLTLCLQPYRLPETSIKHTLVIIRVSCF